MGIPALRNADDDQVALFIGASMTIKCPVCKTRRDDGDPVIRREKAGEVRLCQTCGAGYKIFQGSRRTEQATL
jgi:hypothetical protein